MRAALSGLLISLALWMGGEARAEPTNIAALKQELKSYHATLYMLDIASQMREAQEWLKKRARQVKKPALVLDIDETALSNWDEIVANDFTFVASGPCALPVSFPCGNLAWDQSTSATAIVPTLELYQEAVRLNVAVFFVTGRDENPQERAATELNLWKAGYRGWEHLYLRDVPHSGSVSDYKTGKRMEISQKFTVIANVGDQESDLTGGYAEKVFKLPNPFYLIP
jgi:predicted secreted acid phosphatase